MIGTDELVELLADRQSGLSVTPLIDAPGQLGEGSINIRLGPDIIVSPRATGAVAFDPVDSRTFKQNVRERQQYIRRGIGDPFQLQPGEFVIARSLEYLTLPADVSAEARGRSSWGRLGLVIATATLIQPGFKGTITLELANVGDTPLMLSVGLSIAQLVFFREEANPVGGGSSRQPSSDRGSRSSPASGSLSTAEGKRITEWRVRHRRMNESTGRYKTQIKPSLSRLDLDEDLVWVAPLAIKYVLGVVGERFSGKSTVISFLTDRRHFRLYRLSQFVYEEARRQGLDARERRELRRIGEEMREAHGDDCLARLAFDRIRTDMLDPERARTPQAIVLTGFLVPDELEAWLGLDFFRPVSVEATLSKRRRWVDTGRLLADRPGYRGLRKNSDREKWIAENVDAEPDRPRLADVVAVAQGSDKLIRVVNDGSIPELEDKLQGHVDGLERWWRQREY